MTVEEGKMGKDKDESKKGVQPKSEGVLMTQEALAALKADIIESVRKENGANQGGISEAVLANFAKQIVEGSNSNKSVSKDDYYMPNYTEVENIDLEDILEEPVVFFAPATTYVIVDDKRNGNLIGIPSNAGIDRGKGIIFKHYVTKREQVGKDIKSYSLSKFVCTSKRLSEWLDSHTLYGITFSKHSNRTMSTDMKKMYTVSQFAKQLDGLNPHKLAQMAKENGIDVTEDVRYMKMALAEKFAKQKEEKDKEIGHALVKESMMEKQMLESNPNVSRG